MDDFEKMAEFYGELLTNENAVFEYLKYRCVIFLSSIGIDDFSKHLHFNEDDRFMLAPAEKCSPGVKRLIKTMLSEDKDVLETICGVRLDGLFNLIDNQFTVTKIERVEFKEIKPGTSK
jgi:hypothetical protein